MQKADCTPGFVNAYYGSLVFSCSIIMDVRFGAVRMS